MLGDKTGLVSDAVVGETRDRTILELAGAQRPLLDAVCATGVPVVVVLLGSQPQPVLAEDGGPAAVLHAYQPGSVGGVAVADVLFGVENPSGRVPITIPRTAGQCPIYHGYKNGSEPGTYRTSTTAVRRTLRPRPELHDLRVPVDRVDSDEVNVDGVVEVRVEVANTGDRAGEEVVQLYASIRRRASLVPCKSSSASNASCSKPVRWQP